MRSSIIVSLIALSVTSAIASIDKVILYADSYSDSGNDFKNCGFPSPPYWEGRFTNGPTWAEYVAKSISVPFVDSAYGGATSNNEDAYSSYNNWTVPGLKQQVATIETNGTSRSLYFISIGYNDLNAIINPSQYVIVNKNLSKEIIAKNIVDSVLSIIKKYKAKNFLFMNVPPFHHWPVVHDADKSRAERLIKEYNALVKSELKKKVRGANLKFIDSNAWIEKQVAHPEKLGLSTTNGPCLGEGENATLCDDPENHFFWDFYHPEAKVHEALGAWAIKQLKHSYKI